MDKTIEKYRAAFVKENFSERIYLSDEDYLSLKFKEDIVYDRYKMAFYRLITREVTDEELNAYVSLRMLESNESIDRKLTKLIELDDKVDYIRFISMSLLAIALLVIIISFFRQ